MSPLEILLWVVVLTVSAVLATISTMIVVAVIATSIKMVRRGNITERQHPAYGNLKAVPKDDK